MPGTPSSSSAPGRLSLRAPCDPAQSRRDKHCKHPGQDLHLPIAEEQQPGPAYRPPGSTRRPRWPPAASAGGMPCRQPGARKNAEKADHHSGRRKLLLADHPAERQPRPQRRQCEQRCACDASPCSTVRRKPPFQSFDFITAPLLYSLFTSLLQAYVCPGIKRTG